MKGLFKKVGIVELVILGVLGFCVICFAGNISVQTYKDALPVALYGSDGSYKNATTFHTSNITASTATLAILVNGTSTVYSKSFLVNADSLSSTFDYITGGASTPTLLVELEACISAPGIEGIASASSCAVPSDMASIESTLTSAALQIKSWVFRAIQRYRLKITGNSGNGQNVTLTTHLNEIY